MSDLFDAPYHGMPGFKEPTTSKEAAEKIASSVAVLRQRSFDTIKASGPMTADEVAAALGKDWRSIRPRVSELATMGKIEATGERRLNDTGMSATVWRIKETVARQREHHCHCGKWGSFGNGDTWTCGKHRK